MDAPRLRVLAVQLLERDVRLRMPFRFGAATLTGAPQAFMRCRIRLADGREGEGAAAEMMVPKWFDKNPALSNEENFAQLRRSLAQAREAYLAADDHCAWGHFLAHRQEGLVEGYGPALLERAVLDALCRCLGISFFEAVQRNAVGAGRFEGMDLPAFFSTLRPADRIAARHTVGLLDPIAAADAESRVDDGLPETLEEAIARYGHRYFKLKVSGDTPADLERLSAIAAVLDRIPEPYFATLDGNEQYEDLELFKGFWRGLQSHAALARLRDSILYIEQPLKRQKALECRFEGIEKPVLIDESDDALPAFARARALGYQGVSAKTCKGVYRALVNGARCAAWGGPYFMSAEDLTVQAGLALQQDLALATLLGIAHAERNGHHYVNGMAGLPEGEQRAFLAAHPDLYEHSHGATRVRIRGGMLATGSLACAGYASGAAPDWISMRRIP